MLKDQIMKDIIQAMREKDTRKKGVLQLLKAGLEDVEKRQKGVISAEDEIKIVQREIKQLNDYLIPARAGGLTEKVKDAEAKIAILTNYLPKQLTEDEVRTELVRLGIQKGMNMGEAMKIAVPALSGKTENALISKNVKQLIS